jgi:dienelactone hydrolase
MKSTEIAYEADGAKMIGTLVTPDNPTGKAPGVLVCHEGFGLSDHARDIAGRLAEAGYVAFAMDYYGGGRPVSDMGEAMKAITGWMADPTGIRARATAALGVLRAQPGVDTGRLAAIGYCFGGTTALELARQGENLKAVVGFHSGLGTARPQDAVNIKGRVLVQIGADDPIIPTQQRLDFEQEMTAGGVDWRLLLHGGAGHSFTNPLVDQMGRAGFAYSRSADQRSWRAMIDLFDEAFA